MSTEGSQCHNTAPGQNPFPRDPFEIQQQRQHSETTEYQPRERKHVAKCVELGRVDREPLPDLRPVKAPVGPEFGVLNLVRGHWRSHDMHEQGMQDPGEQAGTRDLPQTFCLVRRFAVHLPAQTHPAQRIEQNDHGSDIGSRVKLAPEPHRHRQGPGKSLAAILRPLIEQTGHDSHSQESNPRRPRDQLGKHRHQSDCSADRSPPCGNPFHADPRQAPERQCGHDRPQHGESARPEDSVHTGQNRVIQPGKIRPGPVTRTG